MIVVTGAAGFIGSVMVGTLNQQGRKDLVIVDDFNKEAKLANWKDKQYQCKVQRDVFFDWLETHHNEVEIIIHLGARTDTTEFDKAVFDKLNLNYTKTMVTLCTRFGIPLIYASSAATYGMGECGYSDNHQIIPQLKPLNPYGVSKNELDKWLLNQPQKPPFWYGLKFFNVYGPNEYHKGRMASVIFHSERQIRETGKVKLFRSHNPEYEDGKQLRDFVYVKDVASVICWLMQHKTDSGIYNLGTGKARSFIDLATATFTAMGIATNIEFIDMPLDIRDKYQYFTEADMSKLRSIGYTKPFFSLEDGVKDYVQGYLMNRHIL